MTILLIALLLAFGWLETSRYIAHTVGYRSVAGMWSGVFGFPGIVIAGWMAAWIGPGFTSSAKELVMLLVNWLFYLTVIEGAKSLKRQF